MAISEALNHFDNLIVEHANGPGAAKLRNYLLTIREQVEALESNYLRLEAEHTALESAHTEFKNEAEQTITDLEDKNTDLELQLAVFKPQIADQNGEGPNSQNLAEETVNVLRLFFDKDAALTAEEVARARKLKVGMAKYHCGRLVKREYLWLGEMGWADQPTSYILTDEGRAYLVDNKLV